MSALTHDGVKSQSRIKLAEWAETWVAAQVQLKPSTLSRYTGTLRTHVLARRGNTRLVDIGHAAIQTWVSELGATSASIAIKAHRVLSLMLTHAVRDGRLARNPAMAVRLPRMVSRDRTYLTHVQVRELALAAASPVESVVKRRTERGSTTADYELVLLFFAYTGVRFGEMAALRVHRVDVQRRRVDIAEAVTSVNGVLVWGTPKNHARRTAGVPTFVANRLAEHIDGLAAHDLEFTSPLSEPLRASNFRRDIFAPAATHIGMPSLVPHELRHTAASLAVAAGADVKVVQQMLGLKSATMTLDIYGHLFDNRIDEVADALDRAARDSGVAQLLAKAQIVDLEDHRRHAAAQQTSDTEAVPPAGFEPATPGLGVRRSIP